MKTLKSMLAGTVLLFVCFAANASVKAAEKPTKTDVINMYVDAITHGKTDQLNNILDDQIQFNMQRGENVNTLNKDQLIATLKQNGASDASVTTTTTVLTDDDNASMVRVDFKYSDYVRTDVVTLSKTNGWAITKVTSSFK